jgi:hypothetical protein
VRATLIITIIITSITNKRYDIIEGKFWHFLTNKNPGYIQDYYFISRNPELGFGSGFYLNSWNYFEKRFKFFCLDCPPKILKI